MTIEELAKDLLSVQVALNTLRTEFDEYQDDIDRTVNYLEDQIDKAKKYYGGMR